MEMFRRIGVLSALVVLGLVANASSAAALVTIGQTQETVENCTSGYDWVQPTVTSGNPYVVPAEIPTGVITSWSSQANLNGGVMTMKVFRQVTGTTYRVIGHDGPRPMTPSVINTFSGFSIPVQAGDVLGVGAGAGSPGCIFDINGETALLDPLRQDLADGEQAAFQPNLNHRLNLIAVVEPDVDHDGFGDETQDHCVGAAGPQNGCPAPAVASAAAPTVASAAAPTGQRAAALNKCKKNAKKKDWTKQQLKKCKKKANLLPV
jgi:hypothetical protein